MAGNEKRSDNPYKRWKAKFDRYEDLYTDLGNPLQLWKPILAGYVGRKIKERESVAETRKGLENVWGGIKSGLSKGLLLYSHNEPYKISPAIRRHFSAAEGASNIEHMYVYDRPGVPWEYPIFLSDGKVPEKEVLEKNIEYVDKNLRSPLDDPDLDDYKNMINLFDNQDGPPVINAATFFDYDDYFQQEPQDFQRWGVREDSWIANQYGERNTEMEQKLPSDLRERGVKVYNRPVSKEGFWYKAGEFLGDYSPRSGRMWFEWAIKKPLIYAVGDFFIEPLEVSMEKVIPIESIRNMVKQKAKVLSGIWRGMSNPRSTYLTYNGELSGAQKTRLAAADDYHEEEPPLAKAA